MSQCVPSVQLLHANRIFFLKRNSFPKKKSWGTAQWLSAGLAGARPWVCHSTTKKKVDLKKKNQQGWN
jgi:hypothetical protein